MASNFSDRCITFDILCDAQKILKKPSISDKKELFGLTWDVQVNRHSRVEKYDSLFVLISATRSNLQRLNKVSAKFNAYIDLKTKDGLMIDEKMTNGNVSGNTRTAYTRTLDWKMERLKIIDDVLIVHVRIVSTRIDYGWYALFDDNPVQVPRPMEIVSNPVIVIKAPRNDVSKFQKAPSAPREESNESFNLPSNQDIPLPLPSEPITSYNDALENYLKNMSFNRNSQERQEVDEHQKVMDDVPGCSNFSETVIDESNVPNRPNLEQDLATTSRIDYNLYNPMVPAIYDSSFRYPTNDSCCPSSFSREASSIPVKFEPMDVQGSSKHNEDLSMSKIKQEPPDADFEWLEEPTPTVGSQDPTTSHVNPRRPTTDHDYLPASSLNSYPVFQPPTANQVVNYAPSPSSSLNTTPTFPTYMSNMPRMVISNNGMTTRFYVPYPGPQAAPMSNPRVHFQHPSSLAQDLSTFPVFRVPMPSSSNSRQVIRIPCNPYKRPTPTGIRQVHPTQIIQKVNATKLRYMDLHSSRSVTTPTDQPSSSKTPSIGQDFRQTLKGFTTISNVPGKTKILVPRVTQIVQKPSNAPFKISMNPPKVISNTSPKGVADDMDYRRLLSMSYDRLTEDLDLGRPSSSSFIDSTRRKRFEPFKKVNNLKHLIDQQPSTSSFMAPPILQREIQSKPLGVRAVQGPKKTPKISKVITEDGSFDLPEVWVEIEPMFHEFDIEIEPLPQFIKCAKSERCPQVFFSFKDQARHYCYGRASESVKKS